MIFIVSVFTPWARTILRLLPVARIAQPSSVPKNQYITATTAAATSTPMSNAMGMFPRLMTTGWRRSATLDLPMMRRLME